MTHLRLKFVLREIHERGTSGELPLLSVSIHRGVGRAEPTAIARSADYKLCRPGDIVLNRMRAFQGALGVASESGLVSPDYTVLRAAPGFSSKFLAYLLRSSWGIDQMASRIRGIGGLDSGNVRTPRINVGDLCEIAARIPAVGQQLQVVDFLDYECAQINELQNACRQLGNDAFAPSLSLFAELIDGWASGRIGYRFTVQLGKMLDEKRIDPDNVRPYLRNTNVQWDRLALDDLKSMTFSASERQKFALQHGDLLVCEGGQPGRSAVWESQLEDCYFQKALMRVRPLGGDSTRYLLWCLRLSSERGDFAADGTGSTILHLPAERLMATRIPLPPPDVQSEIVHEVDALAARTAAVSTEVGFVKETLSQYRDALITEAVAGKLDVTRVSEAQMDESLDAVRLGERPRVLTG